MKKIEKKKEAAKEAPRSKTAFIIGGGPSLRKVSLDVLKSEELVIGCNQAYQLGPKIVKVLLFADVAWFHKNVHQLEQMAEAGMKIYSVVPNGNPFEHFNLPWVTKLRRMNEGLHEFPKLGLNYSTGAAAINLALNLGATKVHLLGFDMAPEEETGRTHWHSQYPHNTSAESFRRFTLGMAAVKKSLPKFAPSAKVINVNPDSKLDLFEKVNLQDLKLSK
jgi:hypothetical protein